MSATKHPGDVADGDGDAASGDAAETRRKTGLDTGRDTGGHTGGHTGGYTGGHTGQRAAGPAGKDREAAVRRPPDDTVALARAYLDLWERQLVDAAVRGRIAPPSKAPAGQPGTKPARHAPPGRATRRS